MKFKTYVEFEHPLILNVIRGFYLANSRDLCHSSHYDINSQILKSSVIRDLVTKLSNITDSEISEMEIEIESVKSQNEKIKTDNRKTLKDALDTIVELKNEKVNKYLKKTYLDIKKPTYENWYSCSFMNKGTLKKMVECAKELLNRDVREKEAVEKKLKFQGEAIKYCISNGKELNVDFTVDNAIETANHIAFEKEVEKELQSSTLYSFSGDCNCENCGGWDGKSNRCECGNRRVSWVQGYGHSFQNPSIMAEAH